MNYLSILIAITISLAACTKKEQSPEEFAKEIDEFVLEANAKENPAKTLIIQKSDYPNWPMRGEKYVLGCKNHMDRPLVFLKDKETIYGINGAANGLGKKDFKWKDGRVLLKNNHYPVDLQPFIKRGVELCKNG